MMNPAPTVARSITTAFIPTSTLRANVRAVDHRTMADVRPGSSRTRHARKRVDDAGLLHVAPILDHDRTPIAADGCTRPDVDVAADDHVADDRRARGGRMPTHAPPDACPRIRSTSLVLRSRGSLTRAHVGHPLPHTDAHGRQGVATARRLQLARGRKNEPRSGHTQWMAKRDRAAVGIDPRIIVR